MVSIKPYHFYLFEGPIQTVGIDRGKDYREVKISNKMVFLKMKDSLIEKLKGQAWYFCLDDRHFYDLSEISTKLREVTKEGRPAGMWW